MKSQFLASVGEQVRKLADERIIFVLFVYPEVLQPQSEDHVLSGGLGSLQVPLFGRQYSLDSVAPLKDLFSYCALGLDKSKASDSG